MPGEVKNTTFSENFSPSQEGTPADEPFFIKAVNFFKYATDCTDGQGLILLKNTPSKHAVPVATRKLSKIATFSVIIPAFIILTLVEKACEEPDSQLEKIDRTMDREEPIEEIQQKLTFNNNMRSNTHSFFNIFLKSLHIMVAYSFIKSRIPLFRTPPMSLSNVQNSIIKPTGKELLKIGFQCTLFGGIINFTHQPSYDKLDTQLFNYSSLRDFKSWQEKYHEDLQKKSKEITHQR